MIVKVKFLGLNKLEGLGSSRNRIGLQGLREDSNSVLQKWEGFITG